MNLALFDLDNTLIAGDSDFQWAQFLIEKKALDRELHESRNLEFYEQYTNDNDTENIFYIKDMRKVNLSFNSRNKNPFIK